MTAFLEIIKNQQIEGFSDKLLYGGQMLLIGMATVFAVLVLIMICLNVFKIVFHDLQTKGKKESKAKSVDVIPQATPSTVASVDNGEIVAVITAAIAAAESENSGLKFRVVSFRRK